MVELVDPAWQDFLRFRDHLIENSYDRDQYIKLKTQIASRYVHDRRAYTYAKAKFIQEILQYPQGRKKNSPLRPL